MKIKILEQRLVDFKSRISKINRKAAKHNLPEIQYSIEDSFTKEIGHGRFASYYNVEISGEIPTFNGWKVISSLEHIDGLTLAKTIDDIDVSEIKNREIPVCDHCHAHKIKKYSYVIQNEKTGELLQVGKSCVKDYIPVDVDRAFAYLKYAIEVKDEDWGSPKGVFELSFELKDVVSASLFSIEDRGFVSTQNYENLSTADDVLMYFNPPREVVKNYQWDLSDDKFNLFFDEFVEHYESQENPNNFVLMVQDLIKLGFVKPKHVSYIAGAVASFLKQKNKKDVDDSELKINEWVGEIKKRMDFNVKLVSLFATDGYYGTVYIHKFLDDAGHTLIWFANGTKLDVEVGEEIKIKATVKKHYEYQGWKQTVINRVKLQ
jgi:hypothetical protein